MHTSTPAQVWCHTQKISSTRFKEKLTQAGYTCTLENFLNTPRNCKVKSSKHWCKQSTITPKLNWKTYLHFGIGIADRDYACIERWVFYAVRLLCKSSIYIGEFFILPKSSFKFLQIGLSLKSSLKPFGQSWKKAKEV